MKNVYFIGVYQVDLDGFCFDIYYNNLEISVLILYFLQLGLDDKQIIIFVEMDCYNVNQQVFFDGLFDFILQVYNGQCVEIGGMINIKNGWVFFLIVELFG